MEVVVMLRRVVLLPLLLLVGTGSVRAQAIVADHGTTNLAAIPDSALPAAAYLRVAVRRASVGGNISGGLDALRTSNAKYDRSRWAFLDRGNPGWQAKVDDLVSFTAANSGSYDVLSLKFCFIDPDANFAYYRDKLLWLESTYPSKRFVWWTIPIETSGNSARQTFNDTVRTYARANGKLLFDIADIESYNAAGNKRTDASGREIMWPEWTSDGGHLSDAGAKRVASAWWWLMARIAGWNPAASTLGVTGISPVSGSVAGGTAVSISGTAFAAGATVTIGGVAASSVVVASATSLTAVTGAHATGLADVVVTVPGPLSATLAQGFFYAPLPVSTVFYTLPPCRLVDTRTAQSPALTTGQRRVFTLANSCGISPTARAVALNVTVVGPAAPGFIRLAPGNGLAETSTINFSPGQTRANSSVVMLATDGTGSVAVSNGSTGSTHVVLDVSGYFE
jgi:hypothetical protein